MKRRTVTGAEADVVLRPPPLLLHPEARRHRRHQAADPPPGTPRGPRRYPRCPRRAALPRYAPPVSTDSPEVDTDGPRPDAGEIMGLLILVAAGREEEAAEHMAEITGTGDQAVYVLAAGLVAILAAHMTGYEDPAGAEPGFWGVEFLDSPGGDKVVGAQDIAAQSPDAVSVGQMVAASLNRDNATLFALVSAAFAAGQFGWLFDLVKIGAGILTEHARRPIEGHRYTCCGVCETAEDVGLPSGGFSTVSAVFGATYTPHESWCPVRDEPAPRP